MTDRWEIAAYKVWSRKLGAVTRFLDYEDESDKRICSFPLAPLPPVGALETVPPSPASPV